jgi:hypothetical protein
MGMNRKAEGGATTGHKENSRSHTGDQHNAAENGKLPKGARRSESSSQNLGGRDTRESKEAKPKEADAAGAFAPQRGAGEPGTPGKGSEVPLNADRPLKRGEKAGTSGTSTPKRPKPESPGGAGDLKRTA